MTVGESRGRLGRLLAKRIRYLRRETERSLLVEDVDETLTIVVVVHASAGPDGSLAVRGVSDCDARSEVILRFWPETRFVIERTIRCEGQIWFEDLALCGSSAALLEPGVRIDGWGDLLAFGLPRCLKNGVTNAEGKGKIWLHSPGILRVPFKLIRFEAPVDECAIAEQRACSGTADGVVIVVGYLGDGANKIGIGIQVGVPEPAVDRVQSNGRRTWDDRFTTQTRWVRTAGGKGVGVSTKVLMNQTPVGTDLDIVFAFAPVQIVDDIVDRNAADRVAGLSSRSSDEAEVNIVP